MMKRHGPVGPCLFNCPLDWCYVKKAETAVQGSGMGAEKKKLVCAWLETAGVKVTAGLSAAIDAIVRELNDREAWALDKAKDTTPEM